MFCRSASPGLAAIVLLTVACGMPCDEASFVTDFAPHESSAFRPVSGRTGSSVRAAPESKPARLVPDAAERVHHLAAIVVTELAGRCPLADPADQAAFDSCRKAMRITSQFRNSLSTYSLWGPHDTDPGKPLEQTDLTRLPKEAVAEAYLPLFMFSGRNKVVYSAEDKLFLIELAARFRHRLRPEQFPAPTRPANEKGNAYEGVNAILLWLDPGPMKIRAAQFTKRSTLEQSSDNPPTMTPPVAVK
jgi:hypothetical protein